MLEAYFPHLKIAYVLIVMAAVCLFQSPGVVGALLVVQIGLWIASRLGWSPLARAVKRLTVFFSIIGLSYAFVSVGDADRWASVVIGQWNVPVNLGGLSVALMMCLRVLVLVLASVWLQESSKPGAVVRALNDFHVPRFLAASIDGTIQLVSGAGGTGRGDGGGRGSGQGRRDRRDKVSLGLEQLRHGNVTFVTEMVNRGLDRAEQFVARTNPEMDREQAKDIAVIVGMATAIMGTKLLQILPGLPFAPGHKNVVIIPFLLLAARLTRRRFGGFWTGLTAGVVSVLSGYGQYGILEIAHFAVPGIMADLLLPLVRPGHPTWLRFVEFGLIGGLLGIGRFAANVLVILLAGAPGMAFVLYLPMFASQVLFRALSSFVSLAVLDLASSRAASLSSEARGGPPLHRGCDPHESAQISEGRGSVQM
jgi:hypothetical protein